MGNELHTAGELRIGSKEKPRSGKAKGVAQPFLVGAQGRVESQRANLSPDLHSSSYLLHTCLIHLRMGLCRPLVRIDIHFMKKYLCNRWGFFAVVFNR